MATDESPIRQHPAYNDKKQPMHGEADSSQEGPSRQNNGAQFADELAKYRRVLKDLDSFECHQQFDSATRDFHQQLYYRFLCHTKFVSRELLSAAEQYGDHVQSLTSLDFVNPTSLIKAAEREMGTTGTGGGDDAARMEQLQTLVKAQKQSLSELKRRWLTISSELLRFACFIRDRMTAIEKLCRTSIAILLDCEIARKKERQKIEEIKKYYKTQLRNDLYSNKLTWRDLEGAKIEFDVLSGEIYTLGREDISILTELYTALRDHAGQAANSIDMLLTEIENKKNESVKENKELFTRVGHVLVSVLSDHNVELKASKNRVETVEDHIIRVIRKEVVDYLFEAVQKERRAKIDRRSLSDRRKHNNLNYRGPERRKGNDRRRMHDRRLMP